jgi:multidrug efflux pump subunit AcrA (membrane-fusion protein)
MYVYAVKSDNTVEVRNIVSSLTEGDQSAVDKGLSPGDTVVIDGVDKLQPGAKVTVGGNPAPKKTPGANPSGASQTGATKKG